MPSEGNQGDEWDAYVTLDTYDRDERGINPWGARRLAAELELTAEIRP